MTPNNVKDLCDRIIDAWHSIISEEIARVHHSTFHLCVRADGGHFEQILCELMPLIIADKHK